MRGSNDRYYLDSTIDATDAASSTVTTGTAKEETMTKSKQPQSDASKRAKVRANEQRRLQNAMSTFCELNVKHGALTAYEVDQLLGLRSKLDTAIKNQHIKDERYAEYKRLDPSIAGY